MIKRIQAFEVPGKGTATESKIFVQTRFTTPERAIIYYDLRDPNGTTPAFDLRIGDWVNLPYAILSRYKIIATDKDRTAVVADEKQAVELFKKKRTDVSVIQDGPAKYFAIVNKMSRRGRRQGRGRIDGGAYELYEKSSSDRQGINSYTLLESSPGDGKHTYTYGAGIIDVEVSLENPKNPTYTVSSNTRGDEFYVNLVQRYL